MQFKLLQPQARWISPKLKTLSISKIGTDSELKHFSSKGFKFKDSFIKTFSKLSILQQVRAGGWRVLTLETSGGGGWVGRQSRVLAATRSCTAAHTTLCTSIQPRCQRRLKTGLVMVDIGPCVRVKARAWYLAVVSKQLNMPWPFAQCCDQQALLELFMAARRFDFWAWWHPGASSWVAAALRLASMGSWHI